VTAASQDVADYDRATELEALGGRMIYLNVRQWKELAEANQSRQRARRLRS